MSVALLLSSLFLCAFLALYLFSRWRFSYWRRKGIDSLNPTVPFGDLIPFLWGVPALIQFATFYEIFKKRGRKHGGVFQFLKPTYVPVDPNVVKDILIRDFQHFVDRGVYSNQRDQPISRNIFFLEGNDWKVMRQKLSSSYTAGKMKVLFGTLLDCTTPLLKRIDQLTDDGVDIDVKDICARFTTDVIGSCAFGIDCNSFESSNSEFFTYGKRIFDEDVTVAVSRAFRLSFPSLARKLRMITFDRGAERFFTNAVTDTYVLRRDGRVKRNDFMQILVDLSEKDQEQRESSLTVEEVIAQAFIFFAAGFDTSATTMAFALFEMALHEGVQAKVREEVEMVLEKHGAVTYDAIAEMKYMDRVVQETLRKYPPVGLISRSCTEPYRIPSTDIILEKGTLVGISIWGLHHDPDYYPEPEVFDPERFSEENKGNIVPGTYLPFGDGPRVCIGLRFGLMQVKVGLATLLKDFEFRVSPKTVLPLVLDLSFVTHVRGGVWLTSKRRRS